MTKTRILAVTAALATAISAWSIPARPISFTFTQPDGTQVTLRQAGDEHYKYLLTTDHQVALLRDGACYLAVIGPDGALQPSALLATDPQDRSPEQEAFLQAIDRDDMIGAIERQAAASSLRVREQVEDTEMVPVRPSRASGNISAGVGLCSGSTYPTQGEVYVPVILVEYADMTFYNSDEDTYDYFYNLLNTPGYDGEGATGSAADYFRVASDGAFSPVFDVYGPITLPRERAYYGGNNAQGNDSHPEQMVVDAIDIMVEQGIDLAKYDNDGDGVVDNVYVFYAGYGEAQVNWDTDAVWPHAYELKYSYGGKGYQAGNMYVSNYACGNELLDENNTFDGIGTFVHEYSHVIGLPDLYSTADAYAIFTPGKFSVLDNGSYNNNSRTPPTYSTFERNALKWIDLQVIDSDCNVELDNLNDTNQGCIMLTSKKNEFFLFENRQQTGWDKYLPYHGMLVWHIEYRAARWTQNTVNNQEAHQLVDLLEAGGIVSNLFGVQYKRFPFPGSTEVTSITDTTEPSLLTWTGESMGLPVTNIAEADGIITFTVGTGAGIADVAAELPQGSVIYNLQGMPVTNPNTGIYIVDGKKVAFKR